MKIGIVGEGVFGTFLKSEFARVSPELLGEISEAQALILAVPSNAYESVARQYQGRHLINICSVQLHTNTICSRWSDHVTGIHPLFGPRSGLDDRTSIVTKTNPESQFIIDFFESLGSKIIKMESGEGRQHDEIMAKTHIEVVRLQSEIRRIIDQAQDVPDEWCPTSFKRLRQFSQTFGDMPEGTLSSILDNPTISKIWID